MDYDLDSETRMMLEAERLRRREARLSRRLASQVSAICRRLAALAR